MSTRREFLKSLLGVALVAPAMAACRTVMPEPVVLPAQHDADAYDRRTGTLVDFKMNHGKTFAQYNEQQRHAEEQVARYRAAFPNHAIFPTRTWTGACHRPQNIRKGIYQVGRMNSNDLGYARGPQPWLHTGPQVFPHGKSAPWRIGRYSK